VVTSPPVRREGSARPPGYDGAVPQRFSVQVASDKFEELCSPSNPLAAVAELVWNSLDAEASNVEVVIDRNELGGVEGVRVEDDGHGMTNERAVQDFRMLGGSWKRLSARSRNKKRTLHGRRGQGRFRAFALGAHAEWDTVAEGPNGLERTKITAALGSPEFFVTDPQPVESRRTGTVVTLTGAREGTAPLVADNGPHRLVVRLAAYLMTYPDVHITYDGHVLDPRAVLARETQVDLDAALGGTHGPPKVRIIEWKPEVVTDDRSSLVLCDDDGVGLHETSDNVSTGKLKLTAYVVWPGFREHVADLVLGEMGHQVLEPIATAARAAVARYAESRASEERQDVIARWKARDVYPYAKPPTNFAEAAERHVFDFVAVTAAQAVPSDIRGARLSLRLIKEALERSPDALHNVLREVLDLSAEQIADFDRLLRTTPLSSIIATTKLVVDRLAFLDDLQSLLFDEDGKAQVKERRHLHEILANGRTWIFGEEYNLVVSDRTLTKVVEAHLQLLGRERPLLGPVRDFEGNPSRRVDLMLARSAQSAQGVQHLVVELKRPSVRLGQKEFNQITGYAQALSRAPEFRADGVRWDFWLVGDEYDEYIEDMVHQDNLPAGVAVQRHPYTVRVRRWAEIIQENRQRLHFYHKHLAYAPEDEPSIEETLRKYLPTHEEAAT
jgi:hypothetical protein